MNISIVGTGYVGLVSAAGFAEKGHNVVCVDVIKEKVDAINSKKSPIYEQGLEAILEKTVGKNLKATTDLKSAVMNSDVTFICVGTPSDGNGAVDLSYVKEVSKNIALVLKDKKSYHVVVVKSTVSPGTTEEIVIPILEKYSGKKAGRDFGVVMNPEFLREGVAVQDFMNPDRIVIGSIDQKSGDVVESIYFKFTSPILRTELKTAEMIKYASNSFLATKISFINEIGNICKKLNVDVYDVAKGIGLDHRISPHFLKAGPGFGGSCFPKDVKGIIHKATEVEIKPILLESVLKVNENQPKKVLELARKKVKSFNKKRISILGLAFKAETDDMRNSPVIPIINGLLAERASLIAYDSQAINNAKKIFHNKIQYADSIKEALKDSDLAIIVTDWKEFENIDFNGMKNKIVIDTRHIVNKNLLPKDVDYEGLCW